MLDAYNANYKNIIKNDDKGHLRRTNDSGHFRYDSCALPPFVARTFIITS